MSIPIVDLHEKTPGFQTERGKAETNSQSFPLSKRNVTEPNEQDDEMQFEELNYHILEVQMVKSTIP